MLSTSCVSCPPPSQCRCLRWCDLASRSAGLHHHCAPETGVIINNDVNKTMIFQSLVLGDLWCEVRLFSSDFNWRKQWQVMLRNSPECHLYCVRLDINNITDLPGDWVDDFSTVFSSPVAEAGVNTGILISSAQIIFKSSHNSDYHDFSSGNRRILCRLPAAALSYIVMNLFSWTVDNHQHYC